MNDDQLEGSLKTAMTCAWILGNFKGINLKVMNMGDESSVASYYVLATATNTTQSSAMADEMIHQLKRFDQKVISKEGMNNSDWLLLDLGDIIVHIFQESSRDIYGLEELWPNVSFVSIPQSYYFSSDSASTGDVLTDSKNRDFF
jgi:ribosome-associated protein